ncbi:3-deoxy-D-manno-octulosonic acid transferase [Paracoccus alkanivorans]|uniref:3-deoxy-D-manno-octulosonic acid transferase n=1 Tax=Paracoccus alkanivorans TaxID=2116655 RepID=A0A3M0M3G9_9RHOB|nr:glycosyltransferase N-terminal domain-containing protein [Paracoccus alkanivorans]RMC32031.1 3-deoxy-D-manno-octulosonic acid transferase [Paracoccus alkanivorans]
MIYAATTRLAEAFLRLRAQIGGSEALRERLVLGQFPAAADIWVHGASVGELTSARPVIEALATEFRLQVTANSVTGRDMVTGWGLPARLAPLDMPGALGRFLDTVRPRLALTVEGEFWPLRSRMLADRGIAQAMIGARMSERSAAKWTRLRGVIAPMLGRIAALSAQDTGSEARLRHLGLCDAAILPQLDLKLLAPAQVIPPDDDPARDLVVLAASTHEGEDAVILDAWQAARATHPDLRLILAPRHPQRGDDIAALIAARGLEVRRRSQGHGNAPLLLADTLGEMPRWYTEAGICLVGGSLTDHGGHTPWEPAAYRCAILHGPHIGNHADNYAALAAAGGAVAVDRQTLEAEMIRLVSEPAAARAIGHAARDVLDKRAGDPTALLARLRDLAKPGTRHDI